MAQLHIMHLYMLLLFSSSAAHSSQIATPEQQDAPMTGLAAKVDMMHAMMVKQEEAEHWSQHMPDVCIKPSMMTTECPLKKGIG